MTPNNPMPGNDTGLPDLSDIHTDAIQLHGLIEALDHLMGLTGPKSTPIWAIVTSALPLARKVKDELEQVMA